MREYVPSADIERFMKSVPTMSYPNAIHAHIPEIDHYPPGRLIREAIPYIGREPQRILDIGSGLGQTALYLASLGHEVTAVDPDAEYCEILHDAAEKTKLTDRLEVRNDSAQGISREETFDTVIAQMVLHYIRYDEIEKLVDNLQAITNPNGIHVMSAYTDDNPEEEMTKRNLKTLLPGHFLRKLYGENWHTHRDEVGYSTPLQRGDMLGVDVSLIPTIAELIVQKR